MENGLGYNQCLLLILFVFYKYYTMAPKYGTGCQVEDFPDFSK